MPRKLVAGLVAGLAFVAVSAAQEQGGGGGGFTAGSEGAGTLRAPNRFEQFISKLKLDSRTQAPQVSTMLQEAAKEATPVGVQMTQIQNQVLNAFLQNRPQEEIKPLLDAYTEAAARMTGLEAKVFVQIHAMLKPNQQGGSVQAFDLMAGWFQPPPPSAGRRGGGGRGGSLPRLDILIDTFRLTKDQEKSVKMVMDEAGKTATPIRDALFKARPAIVAAIQGGKGQADIDAAVKAYAVQATAIAELEMRALAKLTHVLTPTQRADQAALRSTFFLVRGAFINKNWNEAPNPDKGY